MTTFEAALAKLDNKAREVESKIAERHQQLDLKMKEAEKRISTLKENESRDDFHKKLNDLMEILSNI